MNWAYENNKKRRHLLSSASFSATFFALARRNDQCAVLSCSADTFLVWLWFRLWQCFSQPYWYTLISVASKKYHTLQHCTQVWLIVLWRECTNVTHVHGILALTVSAPRVCFDSTSSWPLFPVNPMIHNYFSCVLTFYWWDNVSLPVQNPCLFTISEDKQSHWYLTTLWCGWSDQIKLTFAAPQW